MTVFITAVANIIAEDKSEKEIAVLSAMFVQLADTLATLSVLKDGAEAIEEVRTITT
ncbi:DUF6774 domain-containing protein [Aminipila terrae]|uniref:DUF6774 domain-containing protein n=1 Tax=Aminipila terrae TaxID=2697030 RepID=A0A6P1MF68_9FIRM|nr:DUF6774 domain-containing protein [Aminipila terrae]QHI73369.1 hypothetical protein Ami3637_14165 [Aminipila terrae]